MLFVSHSYQDAPLLPRLLERGLPDGAEARIWPAVTVGPNQRVSDGLMEAIGSCEGLVYLRSEHSMNSFWVLFERNYAHRLGKRVYAVDPESGAFELDSGRAIDPTLAVNWNICIDADSFAVRDIAIHLFDRHKFEIRGDKSELLDNEFRQMLDSVKGLQTKMDGGGVGLLFLSTESITCGFQDYADPYTYRRALKDCETPMGHTAKKFEVLRRDRTLTVWLDRPDAAHLHAELATYERSIWGPFVDFIRGSLAEENKLVVREGGVLNLNRVDDIMVRAFALAFHADPRFRKLLQDGATPA